MGKAGEESLEESSETMATVLFILIIGHLYGCVAKWVCHGLGQVGMKWKYRSHVIAYKWYLETWDLIPMEKKHSMLIMEKQLSTFQTEVTFRVIPANFLLFKLQLFSLESSNDVSKDNKELPL